MALCSRAASGQGQKIVKAKMHLHPTYVDWNVIVREFPLLPVSQKYICIYNNRNVLGYSSPKSFLLPVTTYISMQATK